MSCWTAGERVWLDHPQIQEGLEIQTASERQRRGGGAGHAQIPPTHRPKRQTRRRYNRIVFLYTVNLVNLTCAYCSRLASCGQWRAMAFCQGQFLFVCRGGADEGRMRSDTVLSVYIAETDKPTNLERNQT